MEEQKQTLSEQWKAGGVCAKCRRKSYCSKPCGASKRHTQRVIRETAMKVLPGSFTEMVLNGGYKD